MDPVTIAGRPVGPGQRPLVVAELSGNHLGELDRALALVDAAAAAGADAVKLQTYTADTITLDADGSEFLIEGGLWDGRRLHELYDEAHTPWEWHEPLFARAGEHGLIGFSSPFDPTAVEFLDRLDVPALKIASFEINDLPLIAAAASTGRPLVMSTGTATLDEIEAALGAAATNGDGGVVLLHCISAYPAPADEAALGTIAGLAERFDVPIGLSDHTHGTAVAAAGAALGACLVEKHVTLRRGDGGPDAAFSLEPDELARLVNDVRTAWEASGPARFSPAPSALPNLAFRRSLYVARPVSAGAVIAEGDVRSVRPAYGLDPARLPEVIGSVATRDLHAGDPLHERDFVIAPARAVLS
ncbi:MAG: pseudaminic acid synthase [Actinomycetota bacterium]